MGNSRKDLLRKRSAAAPLLAAIYRSGSFSAAAVELVQTQSTASHKIRALEAALGYRLFARTTRHVEPTAQGELICSAALVSVDALEDALDRVAQAQSARDTTLSLPSSLAMKWLLPAMTRAQDRGLSMNLQIDDSLSDIGGAGHAEMAIRFGRGPYQGLHAQLLSKCEVAAVSAKSGRRLLDATAARPAPLFRDTRAETDGTSLTWADYLKKSGLESVPTRLDAQFDRSDLALQAAIGGLGHTLGRTLLIEADIGDGLLAVDGPRLSLESRYWLVTTPDHAQTERYRLVRDWLASEVERSRKILSGSLTR